MQQMTHARRIAILAMLSALAYLIMVFGRIPIVTVPLTLNYDPKDIIIHIGGFIFGPISALAMSVVVSFVEMITVSVNTWVGLVMNIISTCSFVCPAAIIYKRRRKMSGAVIGLAVGLVSMSIVMMLWNYIMVPIYMKGVSREVVAPMLLPIFLPFNLIKGGINMAVTLLMYKPVTAALKKSRLVPAPAGGGAAGAKVNIGVVLLAGFMLITCILFFLVMRGII